MNTRTIISREYQHFNMKQKRRKIGAFTDFVSGYIAERYKKTMLYNGRPGYNQSSQQS